MGGKHLAASPHPKSIMQGEWQPVQRVGTHRLELVRHRCGRHRLGVKGSFSLAHHKLQFRGSGCDCSYFAPAKTSNIFHRIRIKLAQQPFEVLTCCLEGYMFFLRVGFLREFGVSIVRASGGGSARGVSFFRSFAGQGGWCTLISSGVF